MSQQGSPNYKAWSIDSIRQHLEKLERMKDLSVEKFTPEEGMASCLAYQLGQEELKATQLRKIFHALKGIRQKVERTGAEFKREELFRLMPMLAYATGRRNLPEEFYKILRLCLSEKRLQDKEDFIRTVDFIEAVMAYHKFHYPKGG